jgi:hypothetical protein
MYEIGQTLLCDPDEKRDSSRIAEASSAGKMRKVSGEVG